MRIRRRGFSLIELIASMVIIAVAASGILVYLHGLLRGSEQPLQLVQQQTELGGLMESLVAQYGDYIRGQGGDWDDFVAIITALENDQDLADRGITFTAENVASAAGSVFAGTGFEVIRVTIEGGRLVVSSLFSQ
jgi:prepilin-type N-terminal cleavage/methylation domain-containing protein